MLQVKLNQLNPYRMVGRALDVSTSYYTGPATGYGTGGSASRRGGGEAITGEYAALLF